MTWWGSLDTVTASVAYWPGAAFALFLQESTESGAVFFFFQAEDGIRDLTVTGVQTCALPISGSNPAIPSGVTSDLDGNERIAYANVDIGAYEWHFPADGNGDGTVGTADFTADRKSVV